MNALIQRRTGTGIAFRLPVERPEVSSEALLVVVCLYFVVACNSMFWQSLVKNDATPGLMASFFVAIFSLHALLIGAFSSRPTIKPILSVLLIVTSFATYYMSRYSVLFDVEMINNVLKTDVVESRELISVGMITHVLVFGLVPAALVNWLRIKPRSFRAGLLRRSVFLAAMGLLALLAIAISSQGIFAMVRVDHALRYQITPGNYIVSLVRALAEEGGGQPSERTKIAEDARVASSATARKPRLLVMVVGETVRSENWGLSGYERQTTPQLAERNVINFSNVKACGTSTEVSLPCMFSVVGRENYDKQKIRSSESLLDVLSRVGVAVQWRDNQSGCKGVCDGTGIERMNAAGAPNLCSNGRCLDEVLLKDLKSRVQATQGDMIVVLHQLGNHGPNYFERYPAEFEKYKPVCSTPELSRCTSEQIVNAYDNAIGYTDSFLAKTLEIVQSQSTHDGAFLYVSDHGESLGEYGLYLHGAPYSIAPSQQVDVPMVMWMSPSVGASTGIDIQCVRSQSSAPRSHDNIFHTILSYFDVKTAAYREEKDILASCRNSKAVP